MIPVYLLTRRQLIPKPLPELFAFFERPENLAHLTPEELGFQVLTPTPLLMRDGAIIDYVIKVGGMHLHWRTMITEYVRGQKFIDEQLVGPYLFWHHTHQFMETDEGTIMVDHIRYAMRFGILGRLAHALFVRVKLRSIFDFRADQIAKVFPSGGEGLKLWNDQEGKRGQRKVTE